METGTRDPETNSKFAPKNGWLEYKPFLLGRLIFRGELLVSGRVRVSQANFESSYLSLGAGNLFGNISSNTFYTFSTYREKSNISVKTPDTHTQILAAMASDAESLSKSVKVDGMSLHIHLYMILTLTRQPDVSMLFAGESVELKLFDPRPLR